MANVLGPTGLQINTQQELVTQLETSMKAIYGNDINLASDSPDAQSIRIYAQASLDVLDLINQVYNSFDPDYASGRVLDQRVAINGIQRKGGTFTVQPIEIQVAGPVTLFGLDQSIEDVYTVSDNQGTEFQLQNTVSLPSAGTYSQVFQAAEAGLVEVIPNTITTPVTVVLGVVAVNNPTGPISVGINEETDQELRLRRQLSTAISSQGYLEGLIAALRNINGITDVKVYENKTGADPNADGIPSHSIWVVVAGAYDNNDVAQAIYTKRNAGCGMRGAKSYVISQVDGTSFVVNWDDVSLENLFIKLNVEPIDPLVPIDYNKIRNELGSKLNIEIGGTANINEVACEVQNIDSNTLVDTGGLSLLPAGPFTNKLSNSSKAKKFSVSYSTVIITPMIILPQAAQVAGGPTPASRTFIAYGGYGTYTWSILIDNSGVSGSPATITSDGFYTAGTGTQNVADTIQVVDGLGNIATVTVEVT